MYGTLKKIHYEISHLQSKGRRLSSRHGQAYFVSFFGQLKHDANFLKFKYGFIIFSSYIFFLNKLFLQIELSSSNALESLKIAVELDLSKLISKCEEYFLKELSVENCCEFYIDAMNIRDDELISTCQSFIEQNASDVVLTQGFLNLSKDALIQLISSDKVPF